MDDAGRPDAARSDVAVVIGDPRSDSYASWLDRRKPGWSLDEPVVGMTYARPLVGLDVAAHAYLRLPLAAGPESMTAHYPAVGLSTAIGRGWGPFYTSFSPGVGYVDRTEYMGVALRRWVYSAVVSAEYQTAGRRHVWWFQGIAQSGPAVDLGSLAETRYQMILGYSVMVRPDLRLEVGFLENLFRFDNTPDFGLHLGFTRTLGT